MDMLMSCTFCENFQGTMFDIEDGKAQRYNFCPMCGRPYTSEGKEILNRRAQLDPVEQNFQNEVD